MLKNNEKTSKILKNLDKTVKNVEKHPKNRQKYLKAGKMSQTQKKCR